MNPKYKAIGFDYGGVLAGEIGSVFMGNIADILGVTVPELREAYHRYGDEFNSGRMPDHTFWGNITNDLSRQDRLDVMLEKWRIGFPQEVNEEVLALVDRLRSMGYKVGMVSNYDKTLRERMTKNGLIGHFDSVVISGELGVAKPDIAAFQALCEMLDVELPELAFIDDSKRSLENLAAAGACPILYTGYDDLVKQLRELNILP